uniref:Claudin-like 10 n=1 Tax=Hydra vulgaris TaxID=6087 RepID=A0A0H5FPR5_HYDVU|nr:lens fiber membrane intrinsic protein [Hydra vulgaris]CRX73238.1 Claudin-like 10 [Hydra vulgaris]
MALLNIIQCVLTCVGIGFAISSTVGNSWWKQELSDNSIHAGLWNLCNLYTCVFMSNVPNFLTVTRAFMITGCVSYFVAFVLSFLTYSKKIKNPKISGTLLCATAIFMAVGISVYTNNTDGLVYSWSYIFGWCSFVISIVSAIICFVMKVETEYLQI